MIPFYSNTYTKSLTRTNFLNSRRLPWLTLKMVSIETIIFEYSIKWSLLSPFFSSCSWINRGSEQSLMTIFELINHWVLFLVLTNLPRFWPLNKCNCNYRFSNLITFFILNMEKNYCYGQKLKLFKKYIYSMTKGKGVEEK